MANGVLCHIVSLALAHHNPAAAAACRSAWARTYAAAQETRLLANRTLPLRVRTGLCAHHPRRHHEPEHFGRRSLLLPAGTTIMPQHKVDAAVAH
jgi:hypothetical protein